MERIIRATVDWSQVRRAYEYGDGPAVRVAEAFGVSPSALSRRKRAEGWRRRGPTPARDAGALDAAEADESFEDLNALLERSSAGVARALARAAGEEDADGRDRALKALDLCLRAMEKIMNLRERDASWREACELRAARERKTEEAGAHDEADLRAELERRLARLATEADTPGLSERPERR